MTNRDIEIMLHFITRTEMYTSKNESGCIISFVTGYEMGRNGECGFSNQISEMLDDEFKIKKRAMGWNGQIVEFGKKNNLNWETSFKMLGLKVLSKYFQQQSKNKYQTIFKLVIKSKINQIEVVQFENHKGVINRFGKDWINKWMGLVAIEEKWFQDIWTSKELEIISSLHSEIIRIGKQEKVVASEKLLQLTNEFSACVHE